MPKVIDAKSWQLTPASDGRRYSKYPDGTLPTTLASWSLPATINVPAGTSVGVRQYTADADGWTIAVTSLATGLTYNSGTESIDAANTTAASETATFTLSKSGETPVETTAAVALIEASDYALAAMATKFNGVALPRVSQGSRDSYYHITGTDATTSKTFQTSASPYYPVLWNSALYQPRLQVIGRTDIQADNVFDFNLVSGLTDSGPDGSGTALKITSKVAWANNCQAAYHVFPSVDWSLQDMVYIRIKVKFDPDCASDVGWTWAIAETKVNAPAGYANARNLLSIVRESGQWYLELQSSQADAYPAGWTQVNPWAGLSPTDSDPPYSWKYSWGGVNTKIASLGAAVPGVGTPAWGNWWTFEFAHRYRDCKATIQGGSDQVVGNAAEGWTWAATSEGTTTQAAANGTGSQRFYVRGRNVAAVFTGPSAHGHVFPFLYYGQGWTTPNLDAYFGSVEVYDHFPADASSHPIDAT